MVTTKADVYLTFPVYLVLDLQLFPETPSSFDRLGYRPWTAVIGYDFAYVKFHVYFAFG